MDVARPARSPKRDVVALMTTMFELDPTLVGKQLGLHLDLSVSWLARVFKLNTGVSIVEFRNQLRFKRFFDLFRVEKSRRPTLRQAALDAGFGSYAHFHRLFRARWGVGPRAALCRDAQPLARGAPPFVNSRGGRAAPGRPVSE